MPICSNCNATLAETTRFCTNCGTPVADSPSQRSADQAADTAAANQVAAGAAEFQPVEQPAGPPIGSEPPQQPTAPPYVYAADAGEPPQPAPAKQGLPLKRFAIFGIIAIAFGAVAFLAYSVLTGGDDSRSGPNTDTIFLFSIDDNEFSYVEYGSDEQPTEFWEGGFDPAVVLDSPSAATVFDRGEALVGTGREDGEYSVISVDTSDGTVNSLLDGDDPFLTAYVPARSTVLVRELGDGNERCYAGSLDGPLERVIREDLCTFSSTGQYVVGVEFADEEDDFEVVTIEGERIARGESWTTPMFSPDDRFLIVEIGSDDSRSISVIDLDDGVIVAESSRGASVEALDITNEEVLVGIADSDGGTIERIDFTGNVEEIFEPEATFEAAFLDDPDDRVLVTVSDSNGAGAFVISPGPDGGAHEDRRIANDVRSTFIASRSGDARPYVIISRADDDSDALALVRTDAGTVEVDLDNYDGIEQLLMSPNGEAVFLVHRDFEDGSAITRVDLRSAQTSVLIDSWDSVSIEDFSSSDSVLVRGREDPGDDDLAAIVDFDGRVEIADEADLVYQARFSDDEKTVLVSVGDGDDDELREYEVGSRASAQLFSRDVVIAGVGWGVTPTEFSTGSRLSVVTSDCGALAPDATTVSVGDSVTGTTSGEFCLQLSTTTTVLATVTSDYDNTLALNQVASPDGSAFISDFNDDRDGFNAGIEIRLDPGTYVFTVAPYDSGQGPFTFEVR